MKVKLTEQQFVNLAKNIKNNTATPQVGDIDFEKEAPNLTKLIKTLMANKDAGIDNITKNILPNTDKSISKSKFAKIIPKGNRMMHPLGRKEPITSPFGSRNTGIPGATKNHKGIDISTRSGSPVYAPLDGVVLNSQDTSPNPCGGFIKLNHINLETKFCHLRRLNVREGDKVKKGQIIGYSGGGKNDPMHGNSSGPHLHYEILDKSGIAMNPVSVEPNLG